MGVSRHKKPTKVVIRRLPPSLTAETLLEALSPLPQHNFWLFCKPDDSLPQNDKFCRAYVNFTESEPDIVHFIERFNGYEFGDATGNIYPAIVEFCVNQKTPYMQKQKKNMKIDSLKDDPDFSRFVSSLDENGFPTAADKDDYVLLSLEETLKQIDDDKAKVPTSTLAAFINARDEKRKQRAAEYAEKRQEQQKKRAEQRKIQAEKRRLERDRKKDKKDVSEKPATEQKVSDSTSEPRPSSKSKVKDQSEPSRNKRSGGSGRFDPYIDPYSGGGGYKGRERRGGGTGKPGRYGGGYYQESYGPSPGAYRGKSDHTRGADRRRDKVGDDGEKKETKRKEDENTTSAGSTRPSSSRPKPDRRNKPKPNPSNQ